MIKGNVCGINIYVVLWYMSLEGIVMVEKYLLR